ncbi:hypothetical protein HZB60_12035 [candidate division KSB1 bacterium]|nr:hypothetical protein [candidate division KSB1 bacterium]
MSNPSESVSYVPYHQSGEPPRRAAFTRVEFDLSGLTDSELQTLGYLSEAVDLINPIFRDQFEAKTPRVMRVLAEVRRQASPEQRAIIDDYATIYQVQNSPFSMIPRKNHLLGIPEAELHALAKKSGDAKLTDDVNAVAPFFYADLALPDKASFYPQDLTEAEWTALGEDANIVNSSIARENGKVRAVLNEEKYRKQLDLVAAAVEKARDATEHPKFRIYLDAKLCELRHGTKETRRVADYLWISHGSRLDIIISSALEVYLDNWKNARGEAAGNVYLENAHSQSLLNSLVDQMPYLEANAPWTHRKQEVVRETLPHLRFVDVFNWSGGYVNSPATVLAQSLPNDDWVTSKLGSVNLVYLNTSKAIHRISGSKIADEFIAKQAVAEYGELFFDAQQIHNALHELGHTSGALDPRLGTAKQAREYLENEYSALEEARAELFGMWALNVCARQGVLTSKLAVAGHYAMMLPLIQGLKFEPAQAHNKARNMMWHYFLKGGSIVELQEDGKRKFDLDLHKLDGQIEEMLGEIANIKAAGDKAGAAKFREAWCFTDPLRPEVEARTAQLPLGRGLIFPHLKKSGDRFVAQLEYPASYAESPRYSLALA